MLKEKIFVTLLTLILLFSFSVTTYAQKLPGDRAGKKADHMMKNLKLSDDQYVKVYQTLLDYEIKVDAMKLNKMDKNAKDEQLKKMHETLKADLGKIFTKEQNEKFAKCDGKCCKKVHKKKVKKTTEMSDEKKEMKKEVKKDKKDKEEKKDVKKD